MSNTITEDQLRAEKAALQEEYEREARELEALKTEHAVSMDALNKRLSDLEAEANRIESAVERLLEQERLGYITAAQSPID